MNKIIELNPEVHYDCKSFKGIGGFTKKNTIRETRDGKLLNDLATYLRGFNKSLKYIPASVFVVLDNDDRDTNYFKTELENIVRINNITIDHVFCIAIEEMEAWLLGDENALFTAFPNAKRAIYADYAQDSICGTWELLADVIYKGGIRRLKKDCPTFREIGEKKKEWANAIGPYMNISSNRSPSFNLFIYEISNRAHINL